MKVRVYPADAAGCGYYRLIWPAQALQEQGYDIDIIMPGDRSGIYGDYTTGTKHVLNVHIDEDADADVFVFQRPTSKILVGVINVLVQNGKTVVIDMDDDLSAIHPKNPAFKALHPKTSADYNWSHVIDACKKATLVTLSSDGLAKRYSGHGRSIVIRNHVPESYLKIQRPVNERPIWGWAGALHSHPEDLPLLGGAVNTLKDYRFEIIGYNDHTGRALGLEYDPPATGQIPLDDWATNVARLDVGAAPLTDTVFNHRKSWLKPLEYAAVGTPYVASPTVEYERFRRQGPGGIIVSRNRSRDWTSAVRKLLQDDRVRLEVSDEARDTASKFTIEANAWRWMEAWEYAHATNVRS